MLSMITLMILLDTVHPPAVATSLSFALRAGNETELVPFGLAVGTLALLISLERSLLWLLPGFLTSISQNGFQAIYSKAFAEILKKTVCCFSVFC